MSDRPPPPPVAPPPISRRRRLWIALVLVVAIPVVAFIVLAGTAVQIAGWRPFHMASGGMLPSLLRTDQFFVDLKAYGDGRQPRRGELIVYRVPDNAGSLAIFASRRAEFVQRVVGLPGERIEMRRGVPVINGQAALQERLGDFDAARPGLPGRAATRLRERFADGTAFEIIKYVRGSGPADEGGPVTGPADSYFVIGDNRDDSLDGRAGWWFVPADHLIGRANYVYWSGFERLDRIGLALK